MKVLVTGAAGFIGFHVALKLLQRGDEVIGVDNLGSYYDVGLKAARLALLQPHRSFRFVQAGVEDRAAIACAFGNHNVKRVIHLAAQAGVRYSVSNPHVYGESNLTGFLNILEACRHHGCEHLVYASSSSVYGMNREVPFCVSQNVDHPVSLYAATKKANELMAHAYSHLFRIPTTGLRFFTVYGPWGRPDMAPFLFTRAILEGRPIDVFNFGRMRRDFTYIDDIVEGILRVVDRPPAANSQYILKQPDPSRSSAPYRVYNIGNSEPVELLHFIELLEERLGRKAEKNLLPMQLGDVEETCADVEDLARDTGFRPSTPLGVGLKRFVEWYVDYYGVPAAEGALATDLK
jgi:UDP-glucuronate 4-epimerase